MALDISGPKVRACVAADRNFRAPFLIERFALLSVERPFAVIQKQPFFLCVFCAFRG